MTQELANANGGLATLAEALPSSSHPGPSHTRSGVEEAALLIKVKHH